MVVVAASGTSGAGKSPKTNLLGSEVMGSVSRVRRRRRAPAHPGDGAELRRPPVRPVTVSFTPVLVPMARGILATVTRPARSPASTVADVRAAYEKAYGDEPFVHLLPEGQWPPTAAMLGANTVLLQVAVDARPAGWSSSPPWTT